MPVAKHSTRNRRKHIGLGRHIGLPLLVLLLGAVLRILYLDDQPLSGDEAYSVVIWVQTPLDYLLGTIALATTEPHPPLALLALHGWARLAGDSVLALRLFAALASLGAVAATYRLGRRLGGERVAVIALGLMAISPFQIGYAQFARNYSLWMLGSALSAWFLLRGWDDPKRLRRWIPYVITAILTGYVFYLEAFVWVAHNLFALIKVWKRRDLIPYWAAAQIAIGAALAPWYLRPELRANSRDYVPTGWQANPLWGLQSLLVGDTLPRWLQHPDIRLVQNSLGLASILILILFVAALIVIWKTVRREAFWFPLLCSLTPILILSALALITDRGYFHPRYLAASSAPAILVVALGIDGLGRLPGLTRAVRRGLAGGMAGMLAAVGVIGWAHYRFDPAFARGPDWPGIMRLFERQTTPGDVIVFNYPDPAFGYYGQHLYGGPATFEMMPTAPNEPYQQVAGQMADLAARHDTIWFMPVEAPAWDADQNVLRWLADNRQMVSDQWIGIIRIYQFAGWQAGEDEIAASLGAQFEGVGELVGYRLTPPLEGWQPGATVWIELFWRPVGQTDRPLKVFVHLLGPVRGDGSVPWAQDDHFPQNGRLSTQTWEIGPIYRDVYRLVLPLDLPPGEYRLAAGLYDPDSGERVRLASRNDAVMLLALTLAGQ